MSSNDLDSQCRSWGKRQWSARRLGSWTSKQRYEAATTPASSKSVKHAKRTDGVRGSLAFKNISLYICICVTSLFEGLKAPCWKM